jgi:carbamoyl-phosphate synthase large subunit
MTKALPPTFIVTGGGGDIGMGVGKILRDLYPEGYLVGTDLHNDHPWEAFFDDLAILPGVSSKKAYLDGVIGLINKVKPDFLIPTSEPELRFFNERKLRTVQNVPVVMADFNSMRIGFDKFKTYKFLEENGLPHPWTLIATHEMPKEFPFILKARGSSGSKSVIIIRDEDAAKSAMANINDPADYIFQQFIPNGDQEYTCGLFRGSEGKIQTFILKRKLKGDLTGSGAVVINRKIDLLLRQIAKHLDLRGSINVQLRIGDDGLPYVFEINPRFSSTVCFRHLLGYKDLKWSLDMQENKSSAEYDPSKAIGRRVYRVWNEIIL